MEGIGSVDTVIRHLSSVISHPSACGRRSFLGFNANVELSLLSGIN
jgi:hypothetical protein